MDIAFAGATLSIAFAATLPAALDDAALTGPAADSLGEHTGAAVDAAR